MSSSYWSNWRLSENIHLNIPTKIWVTLTSHICFKFTVVMSSNLILTEKDNILNNFCSFCPIVLGMGTLCQLHLWPSENIDFKITSKSWVILTSHIPFQFTIVTSSWWKKTRLLITFSVSFQMTWGWVHLIHITWGILKICTWTLP